jgi:hypothetical protein
MLQRIDDAEVCMPSEINKFRLNTGQKRGCGVWGLRKELKGQRLKDFDEAMGDHTISSKAITIVLAEWGHTINEQTIYRHRRGDCACGRKAKLEAM